MAYWEKLQNGSSKICGRQPLKILLGPFLDTFSDVLKMTIFKFHENDSARLPVIIYTIGDCIYVFD